MIDRLKNLASSALAALLLLTAGLRASADAQTAGSIGAGWSADNNLIARSLPRVAYRGGPFIRHPRIVTITFNDEDPKLVQRLGQFGDSITRTHWWREVTADYCAYGACIGEGRNGSNLQLAENLAPSLSDLDIEKLLRTSAEHSRLGPLDADTLLLVYLPSGVTLSDAFFPHYCADGPRGFHRALRFRNQQIAYAVIPRCGAEADLTATASHEIIEATTNPDPSAHGFAFEQSPGNAGFTAAGVEPVDPCGMITMNHHRMVESGFIVQRAWSNSAASRGHDPCSPADGATPFLALVPSQSAIRVTRSDPSKTISVTAAADRGAPTWNVTAIDMEAHAGKAPCFDVTLDRAQISSGETANLTITLHDQNAHKRCVVGLVSTIQDKTYLWPLIVVVD